MFGSSKPALKERTTMGDGNAESNNRLLLIEEDISGDIITDWVGEAADCAVPSIDRGRLWLSS